MVSTHPIPSSLVKRLNGSVNNYIIPGYPEGDHEVISLILKEPAEWEMYNGVFEKRFLGIPKQHCHEEFKEWCMPEQSVGYIKASRHGLL
jgi:hypothetical protein